MDTAGRHYQDRFVEYVRATPDAMPSLRVRHVFSRAFAAASRRGKPGKKAHKRRHGAVYDLEHASVGAAYCDVFTCDQETVGFLGDMRTRLGLPPLLSMKDGPEVFVRRLVEAVPLPGRAS